MIISETTRYLVVPTNERTNVTKLRLYDGERLLIDLDAKVDFACPESVMYYDLAPWMGLDITVSHASGKSFGFSEKLPAAYEPTRPRLHFTASRGWITSRTVWSIMRANGICSISTIRSGAAGAICIGVTRSQPTSFTGRSLTRRSTPTRSAICSRQRDCRL